MKKITHSSFLFSLLSCLLIFNLSFAQGALKEIPLKQQIEKSSLIIEGKVISKQSFWDANRHNIYTSRGNNFNGFDRLPFKYFIYFNRAGGIYIMTISVPKRLF